MDYQLTENEFSSYISKDVAQGIYECIDSAIKKLQTEYKHVKHLHSSRTNANIIHDLIEEHIKKYFIDKPNINYCTVRNCFILKVGEDNNTNNPIIIIRFKKLNAKRVAQRNIPKQNFIKGQETLFEMPVNLNAGYFFEGLSHSIYVTRPNNLKANLWEFKIEEKVKEQPVKVTQIPSEAELPDRKLKPKETELLKDAIEE